MIFFGEKKIQLEKFSTNFKFQVKRKYQNMPFNLRNFEEEAKAKMGVVECVAHKLIEPFQVLYEKHSKYQVPLDFQTQQG